MQYELPRGKYFGKEEGFVIFLEKFEARMYLITLYKVLTRRSSSNFATAARRNTSEDSQRRDAEEGGSCSHR